MKTIVAAASFLLSFAFSFGQGTEAIRAMEKPEITLSQEALLETWGWLLAERFNLGSFDLTEVEMNQIAQGMKSHVQGEQPPTDLRESMAQIQRYFTEREERVLQQQLRTNRAQEQAFFDGLFGTPGLQSLGSGLYYQILAPGQGPKPKASDAVLVRYEGRLLNNKVFDTTEGDQPRAFQLNQVIEGWTQGLQLIGEGGKIKLFVPAKLAYGDQPRPGIPPGSTLVFEIELLKIGEPEGTPQAPGSATQDAPAQ